MTAHQDTDLLVVGAGPAGLTAAAEVARAGHRVIVLDREQQPGGVPRHCLHTGFGIRDLHRTRSGPAYATTKIGDARDAGADVRAGWSATHWAAPTSIMTTSRSGRTRIDARAVLLATGCRERPRTARMIPGDRPAGILTAGALQQLVYLAGQRPGHRAVVVGVEHIAFSAVHTLHTTGATVAAVISDAPGLETFQLLRAATATTHRVPVLYRQQITAIHGHRRVTGVTICDTRTGETRHLACDTVVFTGDWVPDYELARAADLTMDSQTRGPVVDTTGATSTPGVFAAGNLLHPAEPADIAAVGGRHAAAAIHEWLTRPATSGPDQRRVPVTVTTDDPIAWVTPQVILPGRPPARDRFILRADQRAGAGRLVVTQGPATIYQRRVPRLTPHRSLSIPATWMRHLTGTGPVTITYQRATNNQPGRLGRTQKLCVRP